MKNKMEVHSTITVGDQLTYLSDTLDGIKTTLEIESGENKDAQVNQLVQISTSIKRLAQDISQKEEERRNLRALADINKVVNSSLEINEVLRFAMDTIIRITGAERAFLMLRNDDKKLEIRVARNWEEESVDSSDSAVSRTVIDRVVESAEPILTTDAQEDTRFSAQESVISYNLRSILCLPLVVKDKLIGVIYADNRIQSGVFTEKERDLLIDFSNQAAIAFENARLFEHVRQTLREVTELKNLMDNVFASIASGVITADLEENILLCNQAAERILSIKRENMVGHSIQAGIPPIADEIHEYIGDVLREERLVIGQESRVSLPERGNVDLSFNISPLKDDALVSQGVAIVVDDLTEKKKLEAQRRMFERMVSPKVINKLDPDELKLGGERTEITSLFADIRGFTSFSENLDPHALVSILNRYLSVVADAILKEEGTIDKFLGDAVMAWFNAPMPQPDHMLRAIQAAIGLREAVEKLRSQFPAEYQLAFGVGIHFGEAVLGLVGTETRLDYTAIGDSVNTAKRIQENSGPNQILISGPAYELVKDQIEVRQIAPIQAKGKSEPVPVYEVVALKQAGP
jgi:PAS domain S-box-containing protein